MRFRYSLFMLTLVSSAVFAKELTLQEAINTGLENSYELKAQKNLLQSKKYQYESSKGMRFPTVSLNEIFYRTDNPGYAMMNTLNQKRLDFMTSSRFVDMTALNPMFGGMGINFNKPDYPYVNNWQTKIDIQLPIYTGGKITTGIKMQEKDFTATKYETERTKEKVIYDISKAYYGALLAKEAIKLANQAYKDAEKHYNTAKVMVENGLAINADLLRAKVYLSDMKSKIKEAENNYLIAKKGLLTAMGEENQNPADIEIVGDLYCEDLKTDLESYEQEALSKRLDLIAVKEKVNIAKNMVDFSKSDFLPTIGAFASYEMNDKNFAGAKGNWFTVGVALNWKLFDGMQNINRYKASKEMYNQYKQQEKGFEEFIKFNVYKAYKEALTQQDKLKTAEENLKYAEEVLRTTEIRYKNQLASMIDLLDTQTMYDKIKFDKAQATYNCQLSILELKYQSGKLLEEIKQ